MSGIRSRALLIGVVIVAGMALFSALRSKSREETESERARAEEDADAAREPEPASRPPEEGIALAIVYDTSGSMKEPVTSGSGAKEPKYVIANRALASIVGRLEAVAASGTPDRPKKIEACLVTFRDRHARVAVPFGPFDGGALREWMRRYVSPDGPTPLGEAVRIAGRAVLGSSLRRKHVLIVTDGENTESLDPATALKRLQSDATQRGTSLGAHFVAFDVDARVFDGVKQLGATVVGAADEKELGDQLEFILEKKILLEAEELPPPKSEPGK